MTVLAVTYGEHGFDKLCHYFVAMGEFTVKMVEQSVSHDLLIALCCLAFFAVIPAVAWTLLIVYFGQMMLSFGIGVTALALGLGSGGVTYWMYLDGMHASTFVWPSIGGGILCLGIFYFLCKTQHRLDFAAANLECASQALKSNVLLFPIGFLMSALGAAWLFTWLVATIGVVEYFDWTHAEGFFITTGFLAFLFWGYFVVKNIVQVTVSKSVARWWGKLPDRDAVGGGPCADFGRASTKHLGSVAVGSFFVAFLESVKWLARLLYWMFGGHEGHCARNYRCCECITRTLSNVILTISRWMKAMNHYAYVYVGIEDTNSFARASREASQLLNTREKETIVNDLMIHILLSIGKLLCAVIVCIVGILSTDWGWAHDIDNVKVCFFFFLYTQTHLLIHTHTHRL